MDALIFVVALCFALAWKVRQTRVQAALDGASVDWTDGPRTPVRVTPLWGAGEGPQVEVWLSQVRLRAGESNVWDPHTVETLVALTWRGDGVDLRARLADVDEGLRPLTEYLLRPDNAFPPGGHGFCHSAPDLPQWKAAKLGQNFADLAFVLSVPAEVAVARLLKRGREGDVPPGGVGLVGILRHAGGHPAVAAAALGFLSHSDADVALAAATLTKPAPAAAAAIAMRGDASLATREAAARLALRLGLAESPEAVVRLLRADEKLVPAVLDALPQPPEAVRRHVATAVGDEAPTSVRLAAAEAFAGWDDAESGRQLVEWYRTDDRPLREAVVDGIVRRRLRDAEAIALDRLPAEWDAVEEKALRILGAAGSLASVAKLLALRPKLDRKGQRGLDVAVASIQEREGGGDGGGLTVVGHAGGGELSVEDEAGRLALAAKAPEGT